MILKSNSGIVVNRQIEKHVYVSTSLPILGRYFGITVYLSFKWYPSDNRYTDIRRFTENAVNNPICTYYILIPFSLGNLEPLQYTQHIIYIIYLCVSIAAKVMVYNLQCTY